MRKHLVANRLAAAATKESAMQQLTALSTLLRGKAEGGIGIAMDLR